MKETRPRLLPTPNNDNLAWLDALIARQAAYYGMTVDEHAKFQRKMALLQERAELGGWDD